MKKETLPEQPDMQVEEGTEMTSNVSVSSEKKPKEKAPKNKSKRIANISLGVMGGGFLATLPLEPTTATHLIQGGFEAGLVGGLADWFAVTALFRHPLNVPIPHTALLPKNRDKITNTILNIVETQWLTKESILSKLENVRFTQILLDKAEEELQKETSHAVLQQWLTTALGMVQKETLEQTSRTVFTHVLGGIDTKETLTLAIDKALAHQYEEKVFNVAFDLIEKKVSDTETKALISDFIYKTMQKKAESSFFKIALKPLVSVGKDKLSVTIEKAIDDILLDLKDEKSENRQHILTYIRKEMNDLKENENFIAQINDKKGTFTESNTFDKWNQMLVERLWNKVQELVESPSFIREKVVPFLLSNIQKVRGNEALLSQVETGIQNAIVQVIEKNHSKIGQLVRENLDKMNTDELIDLMENKIGKELAWIRVNGAICGFFIGIGLTAIQLLT